MSLLSTFSEWSWVGALLLPLIGAATGGGDDAPDGGAGDKPQHKPEWDEDHELVRAVLDGDATAYRGLVERYQGRIYSVCYGMVRNREDARDLAQEAFVKAFKNLSRFRFGASFYTWLCRIAMNVSIDHLRRQKVRRAEAFDEGIASRDSDGVISLQHHRNDPGRDLERKRLHAAILAAMDELPDEQKQVIVLREVEGMAYKEIADVMGIPEGTVMSRLYYARKKLQKALKGERK
jgi:RNA polymerase sigma-70 factor (ECF subfamily)